MVDLLFEPLLMYVCKGCVGKVGDGGCLEVGRSMDSSKPIRSLVLLNSNAQLDANNDGLPA